MTERVFITGFMGSGKSTIGPRVAAILGLSFIDLDAEIEKEFGMSIAEVFRVRGERSFRQAETRLLERVVQQPPAVVALGGGAFVDAGNREAAQSAGRVVWLDLSVDLAWRRCSSDSSRPLAADERSFRALYEQRRSSYEMADIRIDVEKKTPEEAAAEIVRRLPKFEP